MSLLRAEQGDLVMHLIRLVRCGANPVGFSDGRYVETVARMNKLRFVVGEVAVARLQRRLDRDA